MKAIVTVVITTPLVNIAGPKNRGWDSLGRFSTDVASVHKSILIDDCISIDDAERQAADILKVHGLTGRISRTEVIDVGNAHPS